MEGVMANQSAIRRKKADLGPATPTGPSLPLVRGIETHSSPAVEPANDNCCGLALPPCLEVTDEEVRLLQQYLGREILALFS
jgi:hypothetical protein